MYNGALRSGENMRRVLFLAVSILFAATLVAQTAPKRTVVRAARMLDVRTGRMVQNPEIVIEGGRIVSVGTSSGAADAQVINLPNLTLLPGLIDAHTHLTGDPFHFGYQELGISSPREALYGAKYARITLLAGFTTVRNVGAGGYTDVALRDAINDGDLPGPRMLVSGPALGITGGHCDNNMLPYPFHYQAEGVADGIAAVQQKVREVIKYGADV